MPTKIEWADIDEILRLRKENERLKQSLENALHVNELRLAEIAKTLFTGIAEGITGDSGSVTVQAGATCVHCNTHFTSEEEAIAHDKLCPKHPANIKAQRLEKEAHWLATKLANALIDPFLIAPLQDLSKGLMRPPTPEMLRDAARKAVEEK